MSTTLIKGGTVITATETMAADVLIDGEKVVALAAHGTQKWKADTVIDAKGKYLFPGGIDVHTHMELPFGGTSSSDSFETGSRAAAFGGTTTIIDFAVQVKGGSAMEGYEAWRAKADGNVAIDYGLHMITGDINEQTLKEMGMLMDEGGTSFKLFAETCPQYLFFGLEEMMTGFEGAKYVCSPPMRDRLAGHQEALWKGLATNDLQVVSTDHCPFCFDEHPLLGVQKRLGEGDFSKIPNGMPGVEPRFEVMYDGAINGKRLNLNRFVQITATTPAKMFGLYPKKGTIAPGADADIVIFDPKKKQTLSVKNHHMRVDYSAYEGREVMGKVETVLSRGRVIIEGGSYLGKAGDGVYLKRGTSQYRV